MKQQEPSQLKPRTLSHLQDYIHAKIRERGFEDESLHERLLLLTEEVGELIKACRHMSGMYVDQKKKNTHEVGEEVTDVINLVFAVGIALGLDIEKEFRVKEAHNDKRIYKRSPKKSK